MDAGAGGRALEGQGRAHAAGGWGSGAGAAPPGTRSSPGPSLPVLSWKPEPRESRPARSLPRPRSSECAAESESSPAAPASSPVSPSLPAPRRGPASPVSSLPPRRPPEPLPAGARAWGAGPAPSSWALLGPKSASCEQLGREERRSRNVWKEETASFVAQLRARAEAARCP